LEPRPLPQPFESERLLFRVPREEDAPAVLDAIHESIEALRAWMPWAQRIPALEEQLAHARESRRRFEAGEDLTLYVFEKASGLFVGGSGLHRIDWSVPRFEVGYWVRARFLGRGYATEAATAVSEAAFDQLGARRVEIRCDDRNLRSARVAERAGFALEGTLRQEARHVDGSLRDTRVYARVR
jgi:RimJ/RimL family protein N-acetyltransferase